jgi:hypothetical protein
VAHLEVKIAFNSANLVGRITPVEIDSSFAPPAPMAWAT